MYHGVTAKILSQKQAKQSSTGGQIETPTQIDKVIQKSIQKTNKTRGTVPSDDAPVTNEDMYKAFQKLNFEVKRSRNNKKQKHLEDSEDDYEDYDDVEPAYVSKRRYGGSIAYF